MLDWVLSIGVVFVIGLLTFFVYSYFRLRGKYFVLKNENFLLQSRWEDRSQQNELLKQVAKAEFSEMAQKLIFEESRVMRNQSEEGLERLLKPLQERIKEFEKKVDETYQAEGRERFALKTEVERLVHLNEQMTLETENLTRVLKGDSKVQGDWGEMVLENILIASGLREGQEFFKQTSVRNDEGELLRPDIMVCLPDEKQIIIDSKVSLKAYDLFCRAESGEEKEKYLKSHLQSLMAHVQELSDKHYSQLKGIRSPEFVFLFTPIEPAYLIAMQKDHLLSTWAWKRGVAIVTSTTLFASLRTVASIWKLENQNRNAQEIATEAGRLYDKFVGFHDDFEKTGRAMEMAFKQYEEARRKLKDGPGNIYRKIETLRDLGATPTRKIRPELLE